jgi:thioredoxin 1
MSVVTITKDNFEKEVLKSEQTVLLDFWAAWCGPCRMVSPILDDIASENSNVKIGKINVDEQMELASAFRFMIFRPWR